MLIWAPIKSLDGGGVAKTLAEEGELVETLDGVDEDFIGLSSEGHEPAGGADFEVSDLVGIRDLSDGLCLVAVPEEDWAA